MAVHGVVEIFVKCQDGKHKVGATFEDNDKDVTFVTKIFPEAVMEFVNSTGDPINVASYEIDDLELRINNFKSSIVNLSGSVSKIRCDFKIHKKQFKYIRRNKNLHLKFSKS